MSATKSTTATLTTAGNAMNYLIFMLLWLFHMGELEQLPFEDCNDDNEMIITDDTF
jgi:hypothetical protein